MVGLVLFTVIATPAAALSPDLAISQFTRRTWQTEEGLPQNSVRALAQTPDGYLWIATQAGLARFDGNRFHVDRQRDGTGLPGDQVSSLAVDGEGVLWIGTQVGLAARRDGRIEAIDPIPDRRKTWRIRSLAADSDVVCAGTGGQGVLMRSMGEWRWIGPDDGLPPSDFRSAATDGRGGCWIGSVGDGLFHLGPQGVRSIPLSTRFVWSLHQARDGVLWVGTDRGLIRWQDGVTRRWDQRDGLGRDRVGAIVEDRHGNIWIGTQGGGLNRWNHQRIESLEPPGQTSGPVIWSLLEDREGNIWFGSLSGGLSRLEEGPFVMYGPREGMASLQAHAVVEAPEGGVYVATNSAGIHHLTAEGVIRRWTTDDGLSDDTAWALHVDGRGRLWIGTSNRGADRLDPDGSVHRLRRSDGLPNDRVLAVLVDRRRVWVGTGSGLGVFDETDSDELIHRPRLSSDWAAPGTAVTSFARGRGGRVWVGTHRGLLAVDRDGTTQRFAPSEDGLPAVPIWSLVEEADGQLWIGTYGGGLVAFDGWRFRRVGSHDGLPSDDITAIVPDGVGHLWLATTSGLVRNPREALLGYLDGHTALPYARVFDRRDGLRSAESYGGLPIGTRTSDGLLWFATLGGVIRVDPRQVSAPRSPPDVLIETMTVDGQTWTTPRPTVLEPNVREISIRYTAATLTASQRIRFRYRLLGFSDRWTEAGGRREAFFTNLGPGPYRFEVQASDDLGLFRGPGVRTVEFEIRPSFTQTPWFAGLVGFACVLLGLAIQQLRVRRLRAREEELREVAEEAVSRVKTMRGLMPICASCKKIRDDAGYWNRLEVYLDEHSEARLSHGLCPDCVEVYTAELNDDAVSSELAVR